MALVIALVILLASVGTAGPLAAQTPGPRNRSPISRVASVGGSAFEGDEARRIAVDINSASFEELLGLPGMDQVAAMKIIQGRPYRETADLVVKQILSQRVFDRIAPRIVANPGNITGGAAPPQPQIRTTRDLAALAAHQHPGNEWGYLTVYRDKGDQVGDTLLVKIPNSVRDGSLLTVPVSGGEMNGPHEPWTEVRGYVRRGRGEQGTDLFEVTGVRHRADPPLARFGDTEFAVAGWRSLSEPIAITH